MNHLHAIINLIGGMVFLGSAIYILGVLGYKETTERCASSYQHWGELLRQYPSVLLRVDICILFQVVGIYLLCLGICQIWRHQQRGVYNIVGGVVFVLATLPSLLRPQKAARLSADAYARYSQRIRRNPWMIRIVGIALGIIGTLMIIGAVFKLLNW